MRLVKLIFRFLTLIPITLSLWQAFLGHYETLLPYYFRSVDLPESRKVEITLSDSDFVDAEYWKGSGKGLVILTHGLEGSTTAVYMRAMAECYLSRGWDVLAWNFRGCSGRMNRLPLLYHSGAYLDLKEVIVYANQNLSPGKIHILGFSLGANLTLVATAKLGKEWLEKHKVEKTIAISAPINLAASSRKLENGWSWAYRFNFLRDMKAKIRQKAAQFPEKINVAELDTVNTIFEFDDRFTGPLHGFQGAADYYRKASSVYQLADIETPTEIVIALNDPMLARGNYAEAEKANPMVHFTFLNEGGHCGFWGMDLAEIWMGKK